MEFPFDREEMFSASTLVLNNYKTVWILHTMISTAKCFSGYYKVRIVSMNQLSKLLSHVSTILSAVTKGFSN